MSSSKIYKIELYVVLILTVAVVYSFLLARDSSARDNFLHIYFLDVGQGDAILIRSPDGGQVLIDGGPGGAVIEQLSKVMPISDRDLDAVIATHTDADHLSGLVRVLQRFRVRHIIETGMLCETEICVNWERVVDAERAERSQVSAGYQIRIAPDLIMTVLSPAENVIGQKVSKTNNLGIVLRLDYGTQSVLFTADIEKSVESRLVTSGAPLDADFLKVPHHGSKTSTTQQFLDAVTPRVAFIQVGAGNTYGHPAPAVLDRLEKNEIVVYRSDINGVTELVLDGTSHQIHASKQSSR